MKRKWSCSTKLTTRKRKRRRRNRNGGGGGGELIRKRANRNACEVLRVRVKFLFNEAQPSARSVCEPHTRASENLLQEKDKKEKLEEGDKEEMPQHDQTNNAEEEAEKKEQERRRKTINSKKGGIEKFAEVNVCTVNFFEQCATIRPHCMRTTCFTCREAGGRRRRTNHREEK